MKCLSLALVLSGAWLAALPLKAQTLLVDDFSIPQQGIVTDQFAAFDFLEDPDLFLGGREVWGGGSGTLGSLCRTSTIAAKVEDGAFQARSGEDCPGTMFATWPGRRVDASLDLSAYQALLIDVSDVTGEVELGFNIRSNSGVPTLFGTIVLAPGKALVAFPTDADFSDIQRISMASLIDFGEHISINAVWFVVPEPTAGFYPFLAAFALAVRGNRVPR